MHGLYGIQAKVDAQMTWKSIEYRKMQQDLTQKHNTSMYILNRRLSLLEESRNKNVNENTNNINHKNKIKNNHKNRATRTPTVRRSSRTRSRSGNSKYKHKNKNDSSTKVTKQPRTARTPGPGNRRSQTRKNKQCVWLCTFFTS